MDRPLHADVLSSMSSVFSWNYLEGSLNYDPFSAALNLGRVQALRFFTSYTTILFLPILSEMLAWIPHQSNYNALFDLKQYLQSYFSHRLGQKWPTRRNTFLKKNLYLVEQSNYFRWILVDFANPFKCVSHTMNDFGKQHGRKEWGHFLFFQEGLLCGIVAAAK